MGYRNDPIIAKYQSWEGISELEARAFIQEQKESNQVCLDRDFRLRSN